MTGSSMEERATPQVNRHVGCPSNGGPTQDPRLVSAEAYCRRLARGHYENFVVASLLLPKRMRQPFFNVYAFCRYADDLADQSASPLIASEKLSDWRRELERCYAGQADHPILIALGDTIRRFDLPQQPFSDLLDAFHQDQTKTRYRDFHELLAYCERSANPVGRLVLRLAEADTPANLALSDSVCTGLQLANHWQDVARDFAIGRVYLPRDAMDRAGVSEAMLAEPRACEALKRLIATQCEQARQFLSAGLPLAERVPEWLASDIRLFIHGGLATLAAIAAADHDVLRRRPTVSRWKQLGLTLRAVMGRL